MSDDSGRRTHSLSKSRFVTVTGPLDFSVPSGCPGVRTAGRPYSQVGATVTALACRGK
jgi:hypothetical protein